MAGWSREKVRAALDKLAALNPAMPDYDAPPGDKDAMAGYLFGLNNPAAALPSVQGSVLYQDNCAVCHSLEQIKPKMKGWSRAKIRDALDRLPALDPAMPDYTGTQAEKDAMADYMAQQTGGAQ
jgi:mono/diheme cytochrome c family protein